MAVDMKTPFLFIPPPSASKRLDAAALFPHPPRGRESFVKAANPSEAIPSPSTGEEGVGVIFSLCPIRA